MSAELLLQLEALPQWQLYSLVAVVVVCSLLVGRVISNTFTGKRPPVFEGLPFIGGVIKFTKDRPMKLMAEGYAKHGDVFTVPVFNKRITFLITPEVVPHFFKGTDDEMSQTEVYGYSVPTFGKGVVYDVDTKIRTEQFRWFTEALKKDRLKKYVPQFVMEAEQYFSKWGNEGVVDFHKEFSRLITLTAARTLLGREVREQMFEQVTELLHDLDEGMLPISVFMPYLPIAAHRRRDIARAKLREIFGKIIRNRRESGHREEDVLQQFIDAKYQSAYGGRIASEDEIAGLLIAVIFAGQHTSSITTSWTGYHMVADKHKAFREAQEEQLAVMKQHGEELDFDILQNMECLHRCISEALRMHPPLVLVLRYAKTSFTVTTQAGKEYVIPKGDVCAVSPNFSHMLPTSFKEPEKYDIDRWVPPREEDKAKPFAWMGFGGGRHACLGQNFAYLQVKTIWTVLLRNFDFEMLDPVPDSDYQGMVIGPKPCRVKYTRKKLVA